MLFDGPHLIYIFISLALTYLILFLSTKYITRQNHKDWFLKFWALTTVFLHLLPLWVDFLREGEASIHDNMIFPIYFCNMSMYLLVIVAFWGNKSSKAFRRIVTITSYAGTLGALISLFYPDYYLNSGNMLELGVIKSMLSHSTMMIGALFLMTGRYFEVNVKENTLIYSVGLIGFGLTGILVNVIFKAANLPDPNAMFLQKPPIEDVPFLNFLTIAILMVGVVALTSYLITTFQKKRSHIKKEVLETI